MTNTPESTDRLEVNEQQIAWILESSGMSQWLKNRVRSALDNDPVRTLNDVEVLNTVLVVRAQVLLTNAMP